MPSTSSIFGGSSTARRLPLAVFQVCAAILACVLAPMIPLSWAPSPVVLNQVAALASWPIFGLALCLGLGRLPVQRGEAGPLMLAIVVLMAAAMASVALNQLPLPIALNAVGMLLAAMALLWVGIAARQHGLTQRVMTLLGIGWVTLGVMTAVICCAQVFAPDWVDGDWISRSDLPGRAIGNMRQPNHVASLLVWSCVALIWLSEAGRLRRLWLGSALALFVLAILLTASRTGLMGLLILSAWGMLDRKLTRTSRLILLSIPLMLVAGWMLVGFWAEGGEHAFSAAERLSQGAASPSRFAVWVNALELVRQHPLTGVGWGEFNLAWSLTAFPDRPAPFFDHAHNLALQLMVELGLPIAGVVLGLLLWAMVKAVRSSGRETGLESTALRCALVMVLLVAIHSMLEYPLWYAYFLLPTALLLGLCLGVPVNAESQAKGGVPARTLAVICAWVLATAVVTFVDFMRVAAIYTPSPVSLKSRIERGQQSWLFGPFADYSYAVHFPLTQEALVAIKRTAHNIVDARLLIIWAHTLHRLGDDERARYLVDRLREFHHPLSQEWLAQCELPVPDGQPKPFQCEPPTKVFTYRDML